MVTRLRVGGRAQLVGLRPDQEREAPRPQPRHGRQARVLRRGAPPQGQATEGGLRGQDSQVGLRLRLASDESDEEKDLMQ